MEKKCYLCGKDVINKWHRQIADKYICDVDCDYFFKVWKESIWCLEAYKKEAIIRKPKWHTPNLPQADNCI